MKKIFTKYVEIDGVGLLKLETIGREIVDLVVDGDRDFYLVFRSEVYGIKDIILQPYEFLLQRDQIKDVFREPDWEVFMVRIRDGLRKVDYTVDINGWLETPEGKILKSPDYAERPESL